MFGVVVANKDLLSEEQLQRYSGCYCGLCRALKQRHGNLSRMTLNYDMTFLVLLLSAMYEPEEQSGYGRCLVHPMHRRGWWQNRFTEYAADMNVALARQKCLDDWADEKKRLAKAEAALLESAYSSIQTQYPRQCSVIERKLDELHRIERERRPDPDAAANCFGALMGELFVFDENDHWAGVFRDFGTALGRYIYMLDAFLDVEKDEKNGCYNPLLVNGKRDISFEEEEEVLKMLIAECTEAFERLPIVKDADILRNILYSGIWTAYAIKKKKGETADDQ